MSVPSMISRRSLPHVPAAAGTSLQAPMHLRRVSSPTPDQVEYQGPFPLMRTVSTVPHEGLSARNPIWVEVQDSIIKIFKQQSLVNEGQVTILVRKLMQSEVGPMVFDYFRKNLLQKCMTYFRRTEIEDFELDNGESEDHLERVGKLWSIFSKKLIFEVKMILHPLGASNQSMDQALFLAFRDQILFKADPMSFLKATPLERRAFISPLLRQMFLVLQMYRENEPPSDNDLRLEKMVALVVRPYIGFLGVYDGDDIPQHKSTVDPTYINLRRERPRRQRTYISRGSLHWDNARISPDVVPFILVSQSEDILEHDTHQENRDTHPLSQSAVTEKIIFV